MADNRLLFEDDVIKAVDRHVKNNGKLDDDISCILEEIEGISAIEAKTVTIVTDKETTAATVKPKEKERRIQLYENDDIVLEQRGNRYYLSLFDNEGSFQREVTITVKDDYKVTMFNDK